MTDRWGAWPSFSSWAMCPQRLLNISEPRGTNSWNGIAKAVFRAGWSWATQYRESRLKGLRNCTSGWEDRADIFTICRSRREEASLFSSTQHCRCYFHLFFLLSFCSLSTSSHPPSGLWGWPLQALQRVLCALLLSFASQAAGSDGWDPETRRSHSPHPNSHTLQWPWGLMSPQGSSWRLPSREASERQWNELLTSKFF